MSLSKLVHSKLFDIFGYYLRALELHPLRTKALTGSIIASCGDLLAQKVLAENVTEWSPRRTLKFFFYGLFLSSLLHYWYQVLDVIAKNKSGKMGILLRVLVDQLIMAPCSNTFFFSWMAIADGKITSIPSILQTSLLPQLKLHWRFWAIAQILNFMYVPPMFRVLFGNLIGLFWNAFLSARNNRKNKRVHYD